MATRKPAAPRPAPAADATTPPPSAHAPRKRAARKAAPAKSAPPADKSAAKKRSAPADPASGRASRSKRLPADPATRRASGPKRPPAEPAGNASEQAAKASRRPTSGERERRFNLIVQTACLKAGTAAAIATLTAKVPLLGRFAPIVLGSVGETLVLAKIQQQLVREIIALYAVQLSDAEEEGVILLATAVNIGAQQISKADVEALIEQLSGRLYKPLIARVLPLASVSTEIAAAVASTYAVGKRAQALCRLPGTGARDLSDLLRSLSGIDQAKLYSWTADAFAVALKPFRGVLLQMLPGLVGFGRRG